MDNKKIGNNFEQELCELLADAGYWVHNFANRKNGQPADIIAVKNGVAFLIDAKVCSTDCFELRRIEENQHYAMQAWIAAGNTEPYLAVWIEGETYMLTYEVACRYMKLTSRLRRVHFESHAVPIEQWIKQMDVMMEG